MKIRGVAFLSYFKNAADCCTINTVAQIISNTVIIAKKLTKEKKLKGN